MDSKNRKYPLLFAGLIVIAVSLWMLSGLGSEPVVISSGVSATADERIPVRVQVLHAHDITREIVLSARTEPNRFVEIKAEAEGTVNRIDLERGQSTAAGATVLVLDGRDRAARLREAEALVEQRELQFRAIENLGNRQFTTEVQIAEARAQLESARASQERIELEIRNTTIAAPFAGVLNERNVEIGDFVRVGDTLAEFVDLDPLIVAGEVNEREVAFLAEGSIGKAFLNDGTEVTGTVRYLAPVADPGTRSFLVELAVPNPDAEIRAGLSAQLRLQADPVRVHTLSAALLSLADDGVVGVKVVDDADKVRFYPVTVVGNAPEGMHVTGLPDTIRLITVGQGFVTVGQEVDAVMMSVPEGGPDERAD